MPKSCENLFHLVFDHIHDVLFVIDVEHGEQFRFVSINRRFLEATGLQESQVIGKRIQDVIPESSHALVLGKYRQAIRERRPIHWLEVSVFPSGEKTGEVTVVPVFDDAGNCTQLVGTVHDVTEHVQTKQTLGKLNEHLGHLMEAMGEGLATFDAGVHFTYINARGATMLGKSPRDLIGRNCWEVFPEVIGSPFADAFERAIRTRAPETFEEFFEPWGRWFECRISPFEDGFALFFWDITTRKQDEIKLQRMSQLYAALSECNQAIVRCASESELLAQICRIAVEHGGMKMAWIGREDESSHRVLPIAAFGEGTAYLEGIVISTDAGSAYGNGPTGTAMRTHQPVWCDDFRQSAGSAPWHAAGQGYGWGSVASLPLFCKGTLAGSLNLYAEETHSFGEQMQRLLLEMADDISYALGHLLDEVERGREQAQLRMLSEALNQSPAVIIMTDLHEAIEHVNPAFVRRYGYEYREVIGKSVRLLQPGPAGDVVFDEILGGLAREGKWHGELVNVAKDGREYIEQVTVAIVHEPDGRPVKRVYAIRNITEQKLGELEREKLQAQLQHIQKMDSIGRLAGGIAHDFNNMLGVIIAYSELALRHSSGEKLSGYLQEISNAANRSADLTRQLLTFARRQAHSPKAVGPNALVEGTLKMLQRMIGEDMALDWLPGEGVWPVYIDPSQLDQILANLCVNARDAIGSGGRIAIETRNETLDMDYCLHDPKAMPGDYVRLSVSDNGCGIAKEDIERIFEPFFTTKQLGQGTGLGLSTVYGIVEQNKGFIHVYSEPGHGTSFHIYLPRHRGALPSAATNKTEGAPYARGHECILVVEDEAAILDVARSMLEMCGYTVLAAQSPDEAMRIAQTHAGEIQLLITDMIMPGMNGRDLAACLLPLRPGMRYLYMSGYSGDIIGHQGILDEGVHFIQKPFTMSGLADKVREVLDE